MTTTTTKNLNDKATPAYKLFSEGKKPVQVAIDLGLRDKQAEHDI
ncbi:MAG TPA: hypothetical protein VE619_01255 [Nitrososphaeraceae archaeon]|nr:hypothetical protein [Nitrososphaeraceae archaeon]